MRITIIDGQNFIMRARYAVPVWMQNSPHGVVFTLFRTLGALIRDVSSEKVYFVLEGRPVARHAASAEYKAGRVKDADQNFWNQWGVITETLKHKLPITVVRHPHHECDDVVGYLAEKHVLAGDHVTVVSTDTDFIQLYNRFDSSFELYNPVKKQLVERPPYDYITWKALRGDGADNIIGFPGIGDKRAADLVADELKLSEFLSSTPGHQEKFDHNRFMIAFHDLSSEAEAIEYWYPAHEYQDVRELFTSFNFKSITSDSAWDKFVAAFEALE